MTVFRIEGGHPLSGRIRASGNKNTALPAICAALLSSETSTLENVPDIGDVDTMLKLAESMGAVIDRKVDASGKGERIGRCHGGGSWSVAQATCLDPSCKATQARVARGASPPASAAVKTIRTAMVPKIFQKRLPRNTVLSAAGLAIVRLASAQSRRGPRAAAPCPGAGPPCRPREDLV